MDTKVILITFKGGDMRFESFLWALIAALLVASAGVEKGTSPLTTDEQYEAADGGSKIPPE